MAGDHLLQSAKTVGPAVAGPLSGRRRADHHKLSGTKRDGSDWHAKGSAGAKLAVGGVADRFEQEANRAADKVLDSRPLTMNSDFDKGVDKQSPSASHSHLAFEAPPTIGAALAGNSHSFDATTLSFMEQRFDHDFSRVRVHTDAVAARAAADVNACAFTCKNHIVFGAEQFAPGTRKGRHLIAHELAHIVQQKQGSSPLFQREVNTNQEAAGSDSVWDRAFLLADQSRWEEVAELINSFNAENLRYFIQTYKAQPDKLSLLYLGAIGNKKVGPDSQLAKMTRVAYLDFNFNEESRKGNWPRAAFFINAFNPDDVKQRLKKLDTGKLKELHEGAVANAELGVNSGAAKISAELLAGRSAQGDTKALILPTIKSDSKEGLVQVMQVIDSIQPSPVTSDVFTITVDGQPQTLNAAQAQDIRRKAGAVLKDHLKRVQDKAATAADRYKGQNEVDKQHWVIAPIVKTFGRVKDPGPELLAYAASADASVKAAYRAVDAGSLAQAATLLATGEASAISAMKMWQAYFEGIIGAGEMTITVLEITRDASFITLAILATIATGGVAAGALGAEGAAATTTVFGVELGVSGATAANVIVTGAPIVANLSEAVAKVSMGDKVDWGALAIDTAIQIVIARFGGRVTGGIAKALLGNPATKTLASRVTEKVVHAAIMHIGSTVLMTAAQDAYKRLKGQEITWQAFIDELIDRLIDPEGLAVIAVTGVVSSAAEAKYGGSGGKTSTSGQSTAGEAEPSKAAQPKAEAPKAEAPKVETPKAEAPKAEAPKAEAPKAEAPKAEAPKAEAPKAEAPKIEAPKIETPKAETPKAETPKVETPKVEAPKIETPKIETPKAEAPKVEAPKVEALEAEVPKIDAPEAVAQKGVPAEVDAAEGYLPKAEAPRAEAAEMKGKVPASGSKAKPFDIRQLGTEAEPPQTLDPADFTKIKLKPGQEAVYILRDADGTVLKVGKTSASAAKNRFSTYKRAGKLTGKALQLEVHPLKPGEHKAQYFEDALRSKMEAEGHEMPWDNTRGRLKRPGFGTPGEGIRSPPVSKEKMHELLTLHKGNLREVGKALGVHRRTADLWAKSYGLVPRDFK